MPHSEAKVIWDEFVIYYNAVLENFGDVPYIPVIEDLEVVEHSNSGEVIQIMKTTIQGVEDALGGNPVPTLSKEPNAVYERDLRKALKALYDDLLEAENGSDRNTFGFIQRLKVIHENLEEMIPRLLAIFPHLGEFSAFGDFDTEYSRRGDSGIHQLLKSEIKKLAIEIDLDLEQDYTTTETTQTKTLKKENDDNPIETIIKHHWTRQEKIGLASLGVGVSGVVIFFLFSVFL